jgi:hypothetical protein
MTIPHAAQPKQQTDEVNCSDVVNRGHSHNFDVVIVKEDPHVKAWEDARYGIQNMTIEEEYVKVRPNEFVLPARTVFNLADASSTFEERQHRERVPCHESD